MCYTLQAEARYNGSFDGKRLALALPELPPERVEKNARSCANLYTSMRAKDVDLSQPFWQDVGDSYFYSFIAAYEML